MVSFKEVINYIILNECRKEVLFKIVVIQAIMLNQLDKFLQVNPEFTKMLTELEKEGIIYNSGYYKINTKNYNASIYRTIIEGTYRSKSFELFVAEFNNLWKDKKGVSDNGFVYPLLDAANNRIELARFLEKNSEIDYDNIIRATKEFFNTLNKNAAGNYLFAPKSSTFVSGNSKFAYLIEYCQNILNNKKAQDMIKEYNNESFYSDY